MTRKILFIAALPLLLVSQAFACDPVSQNSAEVHAALTKASSPENVQATALREKAMRCHQNAKNLGLKGDAHTNYMESCMYKNDALELRTAMSKGQTI